MKCNNCNHWLEENQPSFRTCDEDSLCEPCYQLKLQAPCLNCQSAIGQPCNPIQVSQKA